MYDPESWHEFAVAVAGAAAALTGLLFVAVSIDLRRILTFPRLPARAATTLGMLVAVLVIAMAVLVPDQGRTALGLEVLLTSSLLGGWALTANLRARREPGSPQHPVLLPLLILLVPVACLVAGGVSLLAAGGGGLFWVLAGCALAFVASAVNAWVLLVEIHR